MDTRLDCYNWAHVFDDETGHCGQGNGTAAPVAVPPGSDVSTEGFGRAAVSEVLHLHEDEEIITAGEWAGSIVVELKDGRFASAGGWCDYTGWG